MLFTITRTFQSTEIRCTFKSKQLELVLLSTKRKLKTAETARKYMLQKENATDRNLVDGRPTRRCYRTEKKKAVPWLP